MAVTGKEPQHCLHIHHQERAVSRLDEPKANQYNKLKRKFYKIRH